MATAKIRAASRKTSAHRPHQRKRDSSGLTAKDRVYRAFLDDPAITPDEAKSIAPEHSYSSICNWLNWAKREWSTGEPFFNRGTPVDARIVTTVPEATRKLWAERRALVFATSQFEPRLIEVARTFQDDGYFEPMSLEDERERKLREIVQRRGQPEFRKALLVAYDGRCAVTDCDAVPALEACHISPYLGPQSNRVSNGLLLRADIHTLFDLDLIRIEPQSLKVVLVEQLRRTSYQDVHGVKLRIPDDTCWRPSRKALRQRWDRFKKTSPLSLSRTSQ